MLNTGLFKSSVTNRLTALVLGDTVLLIYCSYFIKQFTDTPSPTFFSFSENNFFISIIFLSYLFDLYSINYNVQRNKVKQITTSFLAITLSVLLLIAWNKWVSHYGQVEYWVLVGILFFFVQNISHTIFYLIAHNQAFANHVLVIGTHEKAISMKRIMDNVPPYQFDGFVSSPDESRSPEFQDGQITCSIDDIEEYVKTNRVDIIVNALSERRGNLPIKQLLKCKLLGIRIIDYPTLYEELLGKLPVEELSPSWLVYSHGFKISNQMRLLKRITDILLALLFIVATLPIQLLVVLAIKLTSPGPAIYSQTRIGEHQFPFTIYKFRSMRQDAEKSSGAVMSQLNDNRITPIGNFLRKMRLDELPQLFNILNGDMSFIGPRPERPEFVEKIKAITPFYPERHFIKPGLTGWAQIRYPYGDSLGDSVEKLRYDLYYINNISLGLDLYIIFETVKVVLFGRGGR